MTNIALSTARMRGEFVTPSFSASPGHSGDLPRPECLYTRSVPLRRERRWARPTAVPIRPAAGSAPDAIAMAMLSGRATIPTVTPAMQSAQKSRGD